MGLMQILGFKARDLNARQADLARKATRRDAEEGRALPLKNLGRPETQYLMLQAQLDLIVAERKLAGRGLGTRERAARRREVKERETQLAGAYFMRFGRKGDLKPAGETGEEEMGRFVRDRTGGGWDEVAQVKEVLAAVAGMVGHLDTLAEQGYPEPETGPALRALFVLKRHPAPMIAKAAELALCSLVPDPATLLPPVREGGWAPRAVLDDLVARIRLRGGGAGTAPPQQANAAQAVPATPTIMRIGAQAAALRAAGRPEAFDVAQMVIDYRTARRSQNDGLVDFDCRLCDELLGRLARADAATV